MTTTNQYVAVADGSCRVFQGCETRQVDGITGSPAVADAWYWEPADYDGDILWSEAFASRDAALDDVELDEEDEVTP